MGTSINLHWIFDARILVYLTELTRRMLIGGENSVTERWITVPLLLSLSSHRLGWVQDDLGSGDMGGLMMANSLRMPSGRKSGFVLSSFNALFIFILLFSAEALL